MTFGLQAIHHITPAQSGQDMMTTRNCLPAITEPIIRIYGARSCRGFTRTRQIQTSRCRPTVEKSTVCSETGLLPNYACPTITEYFETEKFRRSGVMYTPIKYTRRLQRKAMSLPIHRRIRQQTTTAIRRRITTAAHQRIIPMTHRQITPEATHLRTILIRPILRIHRITRTHRLPLREAARTPAAARQNNA